MCLVAVEKDTEGKSMDRLKRLTTELVRVALILQAPPPPPQMQGAWDAAPPHEDCCHIGSLASTLDQAHRGSPQCQSAIMCPR